MKNKTLLPDLIKWQQGFVYFGKNVVISFVRAGQIYC